MLVIIRIIAAIYHTIVVWYMLKNSSVSFIVSFLNSFATQLIEVCLLVTIFLLGCGWQINHPLLSKKEIQYGVCLFVGLLILSTVSSYCDNRVDGLCNGFSVIDYIFQSVVIIAILICIIINILFSIA